MRWSRTWRIGCVVYAVLVAALTLAWSRGNDGFNAAEAVTFGVTFPASLLILPLGYVVLGVAWNVTGADSGGPVWLVMAVYAAWFAMVAAVNLALLTVVLAAVRRPGRAGRLDAAEVHSTAPR